MNPKKISIYIISVLVCLLALTSFSNEYTLEEEQQQGFKIADFVIKFPTTQSLTYIPPKIENQKATQILEQSLQENQKVEIDTLKVDLTQDKQLFELKSNQEGAIYYPNVPQHFVTKLYEKFNQQECRIIHYGASKIEGDRITSYLRHELQKKYGGSGPGYFPIVPPYPQKSIEISSSSNWVRYALFNAEQRKKKQLLTSNQYGLYANVCRFTPVHIQDTTTLKKAFFSIKPSYKHYPELSKYTQMGIHYGNCTQPTSILIYENGILIKEDALISDGKYHNYTLNFKETPSEIRVELSSKISPDFYGITLNDKGGIKMDNVPTRGDSGFHFVRLQNTFDRMSQELKPDIFLFEYGGNLVPSLKYEDQVRNSVKRIIDNILWVKKRNPEALFFLIGPSDMLRRETKESYPILSLLVTEMKKQALNNGIAFWSMYEAMGGKNSMKIWFDKGYGAHDFVHYTEKGTLKIAELLYKEIKDNIESIEKFKQELDKENDLDKNQEVLNEPSKNTEVFQ